MFVYGIGSWLKGYHSHGILIRRECSGMEPIAMCNPLRFESNRTTGDDQASVASRRRSYLPT